ncbi:unnamed protein product [Calicophoron daubneyi]|uniref:Uncharacterized protein n=1 Tax=Calicophoron daubneyi TaxID=300641 RepID=A0AAV2T3G5_CALDB
MIVMPRAIVLSKANVNISSVSSTHSPVQLSVEARRKLFGLMTYRSASHGLVDRVVSTSDSQFNHDDAISGSIPHRVHMPDTIGAADFQGCVNNAGRFRSELGNLYVNRKKAGLYSSTEITYSDDTKNSKQMTESLDGDLFSDQKDDCFVSSTDAIVANSEGDNAPEQVETSSIQEPSDSSANKNSPGLGSESNQGSSDTRENYFLFDFIPHAPPNHNLPSSKPFPAPVHLENPERETRWYFKYFLGKYHQLYCGYVTERDPFLLTIAKTDVQSYGISQYRAILWRKTGSQKLCISHNPTNTLTAKKVLNFFDLQKIEKGPKEVSNPEVQKDALTLEEQEGSVNFKFGVLYCKEGQTSDEQMYNNEHGSEEFSQFIELLGDRICLKSWDRFKGGLDTKSYLLIASQHERLNVFAEESVPIFGPALPNPPEFTNPQEFREFLLVKLINGEKAAFHSPVFAQKRERTLEMLLNVICAANINESNSSNVYKRTFSDVVSDSLNGISSGKDQNKNDAFIRYGQMLKLNTILRGDAPTSCITSGQSKKNPWQPKLFRTTLQYEVVCGDTWGEQIIVGTEMGTYLLKEYDVPCLLIDRTAEVKQLEVIEQSEILVLRYDKGRESRVAVIQLVNLDSGQPIDRSQLKKMSLEKTRGCQLFSLSKSLIQPLRIAVVLHRRIIIYQLQLITGRSLSTWNQFAQPSTPDSFQVIREIPVMEPIQTMTFVEGIPGGYLCIGHKNQFDLINERTKEIYQLFRTEGSRNQVVSVQELWDDFEPELVLCFTRICRFQKLNTLQANWQISRKLHTMHSSCSDSPTAVSSPGQRSVTDMALSSPSVQMSTVSFSSSQTSSGTNPTALSSSPEAGSCSSSLISSSSEEKLKSSEFDFTWNFEPNQVVVSFPYIFAITQTSIEVRLINNGSLVYTMLVPECRLIASKGALFFSSTSPNLDHKSCLSAIGCNSKIQDDLTRKGLEHNALEEGNSGECIKVEECDPSGTINNRRTICSVPVSSSSPFVSTATQHAINSPMITPTSEATPGKPHFIYRIPFYALPQNEDMSEHTMHKRPGVV